MTYWRKFATNFLPQMPSGGMTVCAVLSHHLPIFHTPALQYHPFASGQSPKTLIGFAKLFADHTASCTNQLKAKSISSPSATHECLSQKATPTGLEPQHPFPHLLRRRHSGIMEFFITPPPLPRVALSPTRTSRNMVKYAPCRHLKELLPLTAISLAAPTASCIDMA